MRYLEYKNCRHCSIADLHQNKCRLTGLPIDPDNDYCSHGTKHLPTCSICRSPFISGTGLIVMENDIPHEICGRCAAAKNTCAICSKVNTCEFETNPDPLPKTVREQIQQGGAIMITEMINPERVQKFCLTCDCWSEEIGGCARRNGNGEYCSKQTVNFVSSENNEESEKS